MTCVNIPEGYAACCDAVVTMGRMPIKGVQKVTTQGTVNSAFAAPPPHRLAQDHGLRPDTRRRPTTRPNPAKQPPPQSPPS
ncbi:hypothetical protein GCM10009554_43870 [Kribbella koreensis]|uniref:Uncharacterized protein n=1 Tax=Kribbella koreensis TaxID=57909 RepID=A0ABN1QTD8_9ACTN